MRLNYAQFFVKCCPILFYHNKLKIKVFVMKKISTFVNVFYTLIICLFLQITNKLAFRKQIPNLSA